VKTFSRTRRVCSVDIYTRRSFENPFYFILLSSKRFYINVPFPFLSRPDHFSVIVFAVRENIVSNQPNI